MKRIIQSLLLELYAQIVRTGILSTPLGRSVFFSAYNWYKVFIEAGDIDHLKKYIIPGEGVVDIGANVGFFTKKFAGWVSNDGFVIAVEPETTNFNQLQLDLKRSGLSGVVKTYKGVAAEFNGSLKLAVNPIHPGDHKISTEGIDVPAFTIDELVRQEKGKRICLIKIDVQGAEQQVLAGAKETIQRDHPAIFVEIDDQALRKMGSSAEKVIAWIINFGYIIQPFGKNFPKVSNSMDEVLTLCTNGQYTDLLFIKQK